jgi:hypothetical protein
MAEKAKKKTARGLKQDRARVADGQDYEVRYDRGALGPRCPATYRSRRGCTPAAAGPQY